jgi:hypothetical protein
MHTELWWRNLRERYIFEHQGVDRITLKWIFKKWDRGINWIDLSQDRNKRRIRECANEPSGSTKCGEFLD